VTTAPSGVDKDLSIRLEFACTNNQFEYESLLHGLDYLRDVGARDVDMFGDSNVVVQQIRGDRQYLDGVLNLYRECCLDIIRTLDTFSIKHIPREENSRVNWLAQQASGYVITRGAFWVEEKPAPLISLMRDSELGIEARPMPGKEEMAQEDGSVMKKDELEVGKAKERPDTSDGMVGPVRTDESAIGNGPA
jgi:hypothetical protein